MEYTFQLEQLPSIPPSHSKSVQAGLAGAISGIISETLVVAGGSNFPDSVPWMGGTKTYYNDVYLLHTNQPNSGWQISDYKLNEPLAYSSCISLNNSIFCVGGENNEGLTDSVFQIKIENGRPEITTCTNYPVQIANGGISSIGSEIFVVGGTGKFNSLSDFYSANTAKDSLVWEKLPNLPVALSHAVVLSQSDGNEQCIYVLGGRNKLNTLTDFYSAVWKYSPSKVLWEKCGDISMDKSQPFALAAGTGIPFGENFIVLFGGDHGILFNKTEDFNHQISQEKDQKKLEKLMHDKKAHLESHPGFNRHIFVYNTLDNTCLSTNQLPFAAQVTTTAVKSNDKVYIPNGEIKPGVRTPEVNCLKISLKNQ
ncbi:hypothetical protein [uncultured Draconibacterium sp.]|uniref:Kelch repeat-containing protein n=1 Tax=uncultured Draconibacterium sp. TaxID=1573823 RepID=UPI00321669AD